jgi:hypothetical protein
MKQNHQMILLVLAVVAIMYMFRHKAVPNEGELAAIDHRGPGYYDELVEDSDAQATAAATAPPTDVLERPVPSNSTLLGNGLDNPLAPVGALSGDITMPQDLLPSEGCFTASNPDGVGHLNDQNFLTAAHPGGLNTVGSSLRNANRQLRSDPFIPRRDCGPWNQSTYDADTSRREFELGEIY